MHELDKTGLEAARAECPYCGTTEGLRQVHDGGGVTEPEYTCEACFAPADDGPCFDDLLPVRNQTND